MRQANNIRANVLAKINRPNCEMAFTEMVTSLLRSPSYIETYCCKKKQDQEFAVIRLHFDTFQNDFENLETSINNNFPGDRPCGRCKRSLSISRNFCDHLFIEV